MGENLNPEKVFRNPIQIGVICKDLETTLKNFEEILGIKDFRIASFPPEGHENVTRMYHGKKENFEAKFCFFELGNIELEIIQPLKGQTVWNDYLDKLDNGLGLHHIKFAVDHTEDAVDYFESKGIKRVTYGEGVGPNSGRIWSFFDTFEKLGFDIETLNMIKKGEEE